jgi:hypothetical protein
LGWGLAVVVEAGEIEEVFGGGVEAAEVFLFEAGGAEFPFFFFEEFGGDSGAIEGGDFESCPIVGGLEFFMKEAPLAVGCGQQPDVTVSGGDHGA